MSVEPPVKFTCPGCGATHSLFHRTAAKLGVLDSVGVFRCVRCGVASATSPRPRAPSSVIAIEPMWSPASDPLYRDPKDGASW